MSNFPRKLASRPARLGEFITPPTVKFLGEQTDPVDEQKKATLRSIFEQSRPRVFQRIYLAKVSYGEPGVSSVLLCFRAIDSIEEKRQKGSKNMLGGIYRAGNFYDGTIISEEQEQELKKVCKPFYEIPQPEQ